MLIRLSRQVVKFLVSALIRQLDFENALVANSTADGLSARAVNFIDVRKSVFRKKLVRFNPGNKVQSFFVKLTCF